MYHINFYLLCKLLLLGILQKYSVYENEYIKIFKK